MKSRKADVSFAMQDLLREKASNSSCTYKISAIALDSKGNVLGHAVNQHSHGWNVLEKYNVGRPGTAMHAERRLLSQYAGVVKTIIICRVGRSGNIRPIDPCEACQKAARKYGVKIMSVMPGRDSDD